MTTLVYTDGACSGNPGPGGWAWAVPGGRYASGFEAQSTNQRMEIAAALDGVRNLDGPLEVVSDSTYVVNCFRDRWWEGWLARGWINSQKKPVANRDLWEPLIDLVRERGDVTFQWVKGHSGDEMNDV
ncbi:MAG: ribonuclease H family protein, partial [Acidimicrobiales bacterium]